MAGRYYIHLFDKSKMQWELIDRGTEVQKSVSDRRRDQLKEIKREKREMKLTKVKKEIKV